DGKVPLKVVILDAAKSTELGRTPGHMTGSFVIELSRRVGKYHWEAFALGETEPCQKQRDETRPAITVHCDSTKTSEKPQTRSAATAAGGIWANQCNTNGFGGPKETCCARLKLAEPTCRQAPGLPPGVANPECDTAEQLCRTGLTP